eukprot:TRINITY_DN105433_c0_g1_i1.p4 TRINITY_DN105433_c0_g1~~TRINITY_DN105433_c0_g1_i1.p4  ORF type:complete len:234 (-),score=30.13 TRINITY_DN105433_c0_g1_i1:66-767(-)
MGISREKVEGKIQEIAVKVVTALEPYMTQEFYSAFGGSERYFKKCFHIFGFDILLDENCNAWLLEINFAPSLSVKHVKEEDKTLKLSQVDVFVKTQAVEDGLKIALLEQKEEIKGYGSYKRVLPLEPGSLYEKFTILNKVGQLFTKLQMPKVCGTINQSKFLQLGKFIAGKGMAVGRGEYSIIYTQVLKKYKESQLMDLSLFIEALELLAEKTFKGKIDSYTKLLKLINLIYC